MNEKLIREVFKKAEIQTGNNKKNGLAKHLETIFLEDFKFPISTKTLVRYYDQYIDESVKKSNLNTDFLNAASKYIGYENYEDFRLKNETNEKELLEKENQKNGSKAIRFSLFSKRVLYVIVLILFISLIFNSAKKELKWMAWNGDHYIEITSDFENYEEGKLKPYKEEMILYFRKIESNCETEFFTTSGEPNVWYFKKNSKELELFSTLGFHPETGKTLKPITIYMIRKYICEDYEMNN
ncbi:hypothetical protein [Aureivirga marina]|uniref:hypothetical protein n=1 Tax=Aureivirga marina TaxID=1182451 RepID=UPI0018C9B041|nr:hypothetical protein [Aureivirga marina]